jgi:hypothetical protein
MLALEIPSEAEYNIAELLHLGASLSFGIKNFELERENVIKIIGLQKKLPNILHTFC